MRNLLKLQDFNKNQTIIGLLRHGKTTWNETKRIQGRQDSPLSANGLRQVQQWGKFLKNVSIDRIISSDLGRVRETVAILQQHIRNVPVTFDATLREQFWGEWEGKTFSQLHKFEGKELSRQITAGWDFRPPGGESRSDVLLRILPMFQNLTVRFPGEQILVVSHEGIIKSILYHLAGRAFLPDEKKLIGKRQFHLLIGKNKNITLGSLNIFPEEKRQKR